MKVFISSTCYDLIDLRAELAEEFREMGITPLLSDERTSEFEVSGAPDENSIQTCLNNVRHADAVVFILSQRYGPKLPKPFAPVSATHLEYLEAKKSEKRRYVYIRDRLAGDFAQWRAQDKKPDFKGAWIKSDKDHGLFQLIDDHQALVQEGKAATFNWLSTFTNSTDLKQEVRRRFLQQASRAAAEKLIQEGQVPIVVVASLGVERLHSPSTMVTSSWTRFQFTLMNVGPVAAISVCATLNVKDFLTRSSSDSVAAIAPVTTSSDQGTRILIEVSNEDLDPVLAAAAKTDDAFAATLVIAYTTPVGHILADDWLLQFKIKGGTVEFAPPAAYRGKRISGHRNFITGELTTIR